MPEVTISIGGRNFDVACQEGEEHFLHSAAKMLDSEAEVLLQQVGRIPEARMLLMAGLMLADKTASVEDRVSQTEAKLAEAMTHMEAARQKLVDQAAELEVLRNRPEPEPQRVEVPVVPDTVTQLMSEFAARAEALAAHVEQKSRG